VTEPSDAVFLSYASQEAEAQQRIFAALCGACIEVFFDQSELRAADDSARHICQRIHDCRQFVSVSSSSTETRDEGLDASAASRPGYSR